MAAASHGFGEKTVLILGATVLSADGNFAGFGSALLSGGNRFAETQNGGRILGVKNGVQELGCQSLTQ